MDRGAWGAIVHGVAKSQTCLKWLSMHTWAESRKMVLMNMFSGSNGDRENRRVNTAQGRRRWGELWEHWDMYITVCKTDSQQKWLYHTGSSTRCSVTIHMGRMVWGWGSGWRQVQEGRDICILLANSCSCMTETNTTLYSNYPLMRNKCFKVMGKMMIKEEAWRGLCHPFFRWVLLLSAPRGPPLSCSQLFEPGLQLLAECSVFLPGSRPVLTSTESIFQSIIS